MEAIDGYGVGGGRLGFLVLSTSAGAGVAVEVQVTGAGDTVLALEPSGCRPRGSETLPPRLGRKGRRPPLGACEYAGDSASSADGASVVLVVLVVLVDIAGVVGGRERGRNDGNECGVGAFVDVDVGDGDARGSSS